MAVQVCVLAHLYSYSGVCWLSFMTVAHLYDCAGVCVLARLYDCTDVWAGSPLWLCRCFLR